MDSNKAQEALRIAQELAALAKSATDFHNAYFGIGGRFAKLFPTQTEREAFSKTDEYREILRLRSALASTDKVVAAS